MKKQGHQGHADRTICIQGASEHNLKNIDLTIPRNKLVCFVGVSGSGKSTIAFDIVAREGHRQYFESLSAYARRYLAKSSRPKVESVTGVSSTIVVDQERVRNSPRSTVGTISEAYTYLRLLFSRVGLPSLDSSHFSFNHPHGACPRCKGLGRAVEIDIDKLIDWEKSLHEGAISHSEWRPGSRMWNIIRSTGYFNMDAKLRNYDAETRDRLLYSPRELFADEDSFGANRWTFQGVVTRLQERNSKVHRSTSERDLDYFTTTDCGECDGGRLNQKALAVKLAGKNIGEAGNMPIDECLRWVLGIEHPHAEPIKPRLLESLQSLVDVGVGYLSLNRSSDTLSGGEAQRVKFARQLGCDLVETIYVMDEPTAGLHPRDVQMVIDNLKKLRDKGNTVLVVEHDESVIRAADHIIEVGPGGGSKGGEIVAEGSLAEVLKSPMSVTASHLHHRDLYHRDPTSVSAKTSVSANLSATSASSTCVTPAKAGVQAQAGPDSNREDMVLKPDGFLKVKNANRHNLKDLTLDLPLGRLTALTGVSGSGKSSLVEEIVAQHGDKVVLVDQGAVGNNKRGCIGTYTGAFDIIRKLFAREHKMSESFFSANAQGACKECGGLGFINLEMNFLGNVQTICEQCEGRKYQEKVLCYKYRGKNVAEVLSMTALEAKTFFKHDEIGEQMDLLIEVGLDYVELGQTLDTLSGGESQRLKLASRLNKSGEFYILDEPTSGLHFADIRKLLALLRRLVGAGNTVLVVEHNLDVVRAADWIIDLGPEGGEGGGEVMAEGIVAQVKKSRRSHTAKFL